MAARRQRNRQPLFGIRRFENAPGGDIKGYELSYQQDLTFLPGFLKNFGVQANFTHLKSELQYILDPGSTRSPAIAAGDAGRPVHRRVAGLRQRTLYYETPKWSARASWAYRDPLRQRLSGRRRNLRSRLIPGTTNPCNAPLINDFIGSEATRNIDASVPVSGQRPPVVVDRGTQPHEPDRGSLGV